jgi:dTDP-4-dehydrorhamnose reductase
MSTVCRSPSILLTGMGGVLGIGLARAWHDQDPQQFLLAGRQPPRSWRRSAFAELDLRGTGDYADLLQRTRPHAVLHGAAMARVDQCERSPLEAQHVNFIAVEELLRVAETLSIRVIFCSTDQVFDGQAKHYLETDATNPLHLYGRSKVAAEQRVLASGGTVVRLPLLLGPVAAPGRMGADQAVLHASLEDRKLSLFTDEMRAPADAALLAPAIWKLLKDPLGGSTSGRIYHLAGAEAISRYELGRRVCQAADLNFEHQPTSLTDWHGDPRPPCLVLRCQRAAAELSFQAPDLRQSLARLTSQSSSDPDVSV